MILSVVNQKGGVAKTTSTLNMSVALSTIFSKKVLVIDLDPQGNLSKTLTEQDFSNGNLYHLITDKNCDSIIYKTKFENLFIIPSDQNLSGAELEIASKMSRENILKKKLNMVKDNFDFILIDCPPSLNLLTINALTASDKLLVPLQAEGYSMSGFEQLYNTFLLVKENLNEHLEILGYFFTMYDSRNNLHKKIKDDMNIKFSNLALNTSIPRNIDIANSSNNRSNLFTEHKYAKGSVAYLDLVYEVFNLRKDNNNG